MWYIESSRVHPHAATYSNESRQCGAGDEEERSTSGLFDGGEDELYGVSVSSAEISRRILVKTEAIESGGCSTGETASLTTTIRFRVDCKKYQSAEEDV